MRKTEIGKKRCAWVGRWTDIHPLLVAYHDREWGVPLHDDRRLFEFLVLEGMQAVGMMNDHTVDCFRYREASHRA